MSIQSVANEDYVQKQQNRTRKNTRVALGTAVGAAGGAYGGYAIAKHAIGSVASDAQPLTTEAGLRAWMRKQASNLPDDVFEKHFEENKIKMLEENKSAYENLLKTVKKCKTKWAVIGGLVGGAIVLGISLLAGHKNKKAQKTQ